MLHPGVFPQWSFRKHRLFLRNKNFSVGLTTDIPAIKQKSEKVKVAVKVTIGSKWIGSYFILLIVVQRHLILFSLKGAVYESINCLLKCTGVQKKDTDKRGCTEAGVK